MLIVLVCCAAIRRNNKYKCIVLGTPPLDPTGAFLVALPFTKYWPRHCLRPVYIAETEVN